MLALAESGYDYPAIKSEFSAALRAFSRDGDIKNIDTVTLLNEKGLSRTSFLRDPKYTHIDTNRFSSAIKALEDSDPAPFVELAVELTHLGIEIEFNNGKGENDYNAGERVEELIVCHRGDLKMILGNLA
jgi:hypothetical protein